MGYKTRRSKACEEVDFVEEWRDVVGFEGVYQVSSAGRVRSLTRRVYNHMMRGRVLKQARKANGYMQLSLSANGVKLKHVYVHRLVACAFLPNPNNLPDVNHINHNKQDNRVDNLEWVTRSENILHARRLLRETNHYKPKASTKFVRDVIEYRERVINLFQKGYTAEEIGAEIGRGRDFVTNILILYDQKSSAV